MNEITISFTIGQMFAIIGAICLIFITYALVKFLLKASATAKEAKALMEDSRLILEDIRETKMAIIGTISKARRTLSVVETVASHRAKKKKKKGDI